MHIYTFWIHARITRYRLSKTLHKKVLLWFYLLSFKSLKKIFDITHSEFRTKKRTLQWTFSLSSLSANSFPQARIVNDFYYYSCVSFHIFYAYVNICVHIYYLSPFWIDNNILYTIFCIWLFSFGIFWSLFISVQKVIPFSFKVYSNPLHGNTVIYLTSSLVKGF